MPQPPEAIAYCHSCGNAMNVSAVAPFANVECPTCGKHTRVKREFGPYTLVSRHAVGGMSMVFLAHDNTLDREVALKILSEEYSADERRIAAFEEEARITASFSHPHVVRVLTTGKAFGRFYIAMELVPGGHFEHQIRERGKIPELEMLPLAIEVAQGLKAAHSAGLIHRDVKPGNILLDSEGHAKLVDFGLALVTKGGKAKAAELWATPYYVPPETIEGYPEDFRSDIYAFGATLYHALAGVPSCGEETMATDLLREAKQRVVPLGVTEPSISVETSKIVDRSMAYDPNDRYQSYDELISRLESAQKRLISGVSSESSGIAAKRRARTKRAEILAISAAAVILLGGTAAGIWWVTRDEPTRVSSHATEGGSMDPIPDSTPPDADEATAIAKMYREARAAVEARDFGKASAAFSDLLTNEKVQEPTRTWAGIESVVAAYLDGDSTAAKKQAKVVADHIKSLPETTTRLDDSIVRMLGELATLPGIPGKSLDLSKSDAPHFMSWFLAALKNWEQGVRGDEFAGFSPVVSANIAAEEQWLSIYQNIAKDYVEDSGLLSEEVFEKVPSDASGCEGAVAELEEIHGKLKTRGRAKFNVRAWQLDLRRQAKLFSTAKPPVASGISGGAAIDENTGLPFPVLTEVMPRLEKFAAACQFQEGVAYIQSLTSDPEGATRASLESVADSSGKFITDLTADLFAEPVSGDFQTRKGEAVTRLSSERVGEITITLAAGGKRIASWSDLTPDSIISLHRALLKRPMNDIERLLRNERAICYDWLAGNRERAVSAAAQLSLSYPDFKARWVQLSSGLP